MIHILNNDTVLLNGNILPELEINRYIGLDESGDDLILEKNVLDRVLDEDSMMQFLRENPQVANKLVSYSGTLVYMGRYRNEVGMNFISRTSRNLEGSNTYGIFLEKCRDRYIQEMKGQVLDEAPVRRNQVTVDYIAPGAEATDIELQERGGSDRYIHVGLYRPAAFQHDSESISGTSGHARRSSASDIKFHTFECPFGTSRKHKISVGNAAEASMYYEQALRNELDWKSLFRDLRSRNLVRGITPSEEERLISEMKSQFSWMRECILRDNSLAGKIIVADSLVIPDKSMGRSVYHSDLAPSPAHILARYINNPHLLYTSSENSVVRAIERKDKEESVRFGSINGKGEITIVVDGSDTIGGRVPGTRAVASKKQIAKRDNQGKILKDSNGKIIYETKNIKEYEFKSASEVEIDYKAFSERMDTILMNIDPNIKIKFISGVNVGSDKMLMQYVKDKGGNIYDWSYSKAGVNNTYGHENKNKDNRFSVVRMRNFQEVYPVLVGREDNVTFQLNQISEDSEVHFNRTDGLNPDGFITFSVSQDTWNARILERGSLAEGSGMPFLHVIDNYTEKEQLMELEQASETAKFSILGEPSYQDSLFINERKTEWDLKAASVMSHMPSGAIDIAIPFIANRYDASVFVNGVPFNSVYGVYCALMMKNAGVDDRQAFRDLMQASDGMITIQQVYDKYMLNKVMNDSVKEKCMRNAVHMMSHASSRFADSLLATGSSEIVSVSSFGDSALFTDVNGKGENRFGIVLMSERATLMRELERSRARDEEESKRVSAELLRRNKKISARAAGEKIATGLPRTHQEAMDGVWFLGTSQPVTIALPLDSPSFVLWEEGYQEDVLNREKAARPFIEDVEGNRISNDYVYFFPSNLTAIAARYPLTSDPAQRDLTGLTRTNPNTGEEYICAYGIAVKRNKEFYEHDNKFGKSCSFFLDNDGATLANSIYSANAEARATALRHGLALCYSAYSTRYGDLKDSLSRVFEPKIWDYERTKEIFDRHTGKITQEGGVIIPREVTVSTYNKATRSTEYTTEFVRKKAWVDNPHAAPKNLAMVKRFEAMLENGRQYPLTCFSLPQTDYEGITSEQFMNDLNFALNMANATALATGKNLRFPLDKNGKINLGPGVPEEFREMAERRINHYIGVCLDENLIAGKIPVITRIPISKAFTNDRPLERDGSDMILRPNDLLVAFGRYNFHDILVGNRAPLHEMAFTDEEGNIFKITDTRFSTKFTKGEINKYLSYERNDECRFNIRSSDSTKIPAFILAVKSYIARAREIEIEYKLFSEEECRQGVDGLNDLSTTGYVHLLASNEENYELTDKHVVSARPNETMVEMDPDWINVRGRQGREDDEIYAGKELANDGFKGWVVFRYKLPDGTQSNWKTVNDLELAKDIILHSVNRVYKTDTRIIPSSKVIDATLKSLAVKDCGNVLFDIDVKLPEIKADNKVISLPDTPVVEVPVQEMVMSETLDTTQTIQLNNDIIFTASAGGYQKRTWENAQADDVDFTLAFATDFNTYGEKATARAAGESLISIDLPVKSNGGLNMSPKAIQNAAEVIIQSLPDEFINNLPCGINVAGNGIYTLAKDGICQEDLDQFICAVGVELTARGVQLSSVRSGGQTGVDEAGAAMGKALGIPTTVHVPSNWAFRGKDGKDVINNQEAFKQRFTSKDYNQLLSTAEALLKKSNKKTTLGINIKM